MKGNNNMLKYIIWVAILFIACSDNNPADNSFVEPPEVTCRIEPEDDNPFIGTWVAQDTNSLFYFESNELFSDLAFSQNENFNPPETLQFTENHKWLSNGGCGYAGEDGWEYYGGCYVYLNVEDEPDTVSFFFPYYGWHDLYATYVFRDDTLEFDLLEFDIEGSNLLDIELDRKTKYVKIEK